MDYRKKHKGRIQSQGINLEEFFSRAQDMPITTNEVLKGLNNLELSLSKKDKALRKREF